MTVEPDHRGLPRERDFRLETFLTTLRPKEFSPTLDLLQEGRFERYRETLDYRISVGIKTLGEIDEHTGATDYIDWIAEQTNDLWSFHIDGDDLDLSTHMLVFGFCNARDATLFKLFKYGL